MEDKPKVYFTKTITPEKVVELFKLLNFKLEGRIGVKVHSGEDGNPNFLKPEFLKPMIDFVKGTVIETNTTGTEKWSKRVNNELHKKLLEDHGWSKLFKTDILDAEGEMELPCEKGKGIKKNYVGVGIKNYDSILILSHFKGHPEGGFGGALKQLAIGFASRNGKAYIHSVGDTTDPIGVWKNHKRLQETEMEFKDAMADAAWTIVDFYKRKIAYINIIVNLSVDCDCVGSDAKLPCMKDIGIAASLDPVALDQACVDMIYNSDDPGKNEMIQRIEEKHGKRIFEEAVALGIGKREYELINVE